MAGLVGVEGVTWCCGGGAGGAAASADGRGDRLGVYEEAEAVNTAMIREVRKEWAERFGGGMPPFDVAYFAALREGKSWPEASKAGADALLDAFVEALALRAAEREVRR